jgi:hypothetical protein
VPANDSRDAHGTPPLTAQKVRQGAVLGHVRYVLAFSTGAAILAGVIIWFAFFG